MESIEKIVVNAGGASTVARACGVSPQAVQHWISSNRVPANRVLAIEALIEGSVSRYELRPDVFGVAPAANDLMCLVCPCVKPNETCLKGVSPHGTQCNDT